MRPPGRGGARARLAYGLASVALAAGAYALVSNLFQLVDTSALPRSARLLLRPGILPPPQSLAEAFLVVLQDGTWLLAVGGSVTRVLEGLLLGVTVGVGTGLLMAWFEAVDHYVEPLYNLLRPIPPLAFVTLFILWFGIGEASKVLLVAYGVAMVTVVPAYQGVRDIPAPYLKAARMLGATRRQLVWRVILPAAAPRILAGLRLAVMAAWGIIVAAELIASTSGLGYLIILAQTQYDTALVMVGIGSLAVIGFAMDVVVRLGIARQTRWLPRVTE
jgi:ABC-type nitrate/sulfonate/bicarbonate transport system permease component